MKNRNIIFTTVLLGFSCFALLPVAAAPPGGTSNVNVVNTPTVKDADNPARQPFHASAYVGFSNGSASATATITTVPAGKRLIIEHVSVYGQMLVGQTMRRAAIGTSLLNYNDGGYVFDDLTVSPQGSDGVKDYFVASQDVRLYADPGTQVLGTAIRNSTAGANPDTAVQFSISGYLVDVP
jgi:hypothetical protein